MRRATLRERTRAGAFARAPKATPRDRAKFERSEVASEVARRGFFEETMPNPILFRVQIYSFKLSFM